MASPKFPGLRQLYELDCRRKPTGLRVPEEALRAIGGPRHAANLFRGLTQDKPTESFLAVYLDTHNKPIAVQEIARGGRNVVSLSPSDVFHPATAVGAHAIIVAHNHPSGDPTPSADDIALTARLKSAGAIVGVDVLDHLVLGSTGYYSTADARMYKDVWQQDRDYRSGGWGTLFAVAVVGAIGFAAWRRYAGRGPTRIVGQPFLGIDVLGEIG